MLVEYGISYNVLMYVSKISITHRYKGKTAPEHVSFVNPQLIRKKFTVVLSRRTCNINISRYTTEILFEAAVNSTLTRPTKIRFQQPMLALTGD